MLNAIVAGVAALSLFTIPVTDDEAAAPPPSDIITINAVTVIGSGCKKDTYAVAVAPDNTAFTITYSEYLAQVGPGIPAAESRKNCQIVVNVKVPSGFTYAIAGVDYRGYLNLAKGATASQRANYYFQGSPQTVYTTHALPKGPKDDNWQASDQVGIAALVYKPCGAERYLNINTEVKVNAGTSSSSSSSFVTMDSTDGSVSTEYHFSWMHCPKK
jgi:hypothetical protein